MDNIYVVLAEAAEEKFDYYGFGFRAANRKGQEWLEVENKKVGNVRTRWNHGANKQTHRPKKGRGAGIKGF